eukprot:scaffold118730_cov48-Cyclotella_meneghiniana.AAC.3
MDNFADCRLITNLYSLCRCGGPISFCSDKLLNRPQTKEELLAVFDVPSVLFDSMKCGRWGDKTPILLASAPSPLIMKKKKLFLRMKSRLVMLWLSKPVAEAAETEPVLSRKLILFQSLMSLSPWECIHTKMTTDLTADITYKSCNTEFDDDSSFMPRRKSDLKKQVLSSDIDKWEFLHDVSVYAINTLETEDATEFISLFG